MDAPKIPITALTTLSDQLTGQLHFDQLQRVLYATDASVYRALPQAIALPATVKDLALLIQFANAHHTSLIPRAAGTSLAGQCVGEGIVVDISKHFTKIIELNVKERWVRVQPGVVRDELNAFLKPHGLFFSPITSTANRAMIGGMVGNNSSGTTSIEYGTTRDKVVEMEVLLADGAKASFGALSPDELPQKCALPGLEGDLYRQVTKVLNNKEQQAEIREQFPKSSIHRRNTGYAVDALLETAAFTNNDTPFNFCKLLCGSEGTLAFTTEIKLQLDPLPLPDHVVVAAHFSELDQSMRATQIAMRHQPSACELMDKIILDCTKENIEYRKHRFFIEGDPATVLMVELRASSVEAAQAEANLLIEELKAQGLGYAYPIIPAAQTKAVWSLRSAGLGLLANIPGDAKAVACIEDTAVDLDDLPEYIREFSELMKGFDQQPVYYAHAGAGELHLRPILDLKKEVDVQRFYDISLATAKLVKKYRGSLSGEHGDGRVRAAFIPLMVGEKNYALFREIKQTWDPNGIFNPGKIVDAPPMNSSLRYAPEQPDRSYPTILDFSDAGGILRAAEKCNGSGDCRKLPLSGGTMCPSYQATRNEKDTTRARANTLREFLTKSEQKNAFDHQEIKEVMDLCLSCKGCTSECPSNVDMAGLKAEFLHQYYQSNGIPLRARAFAYINTFNRIGSLWPGLYNLLLTNPLTAGWSKRLLQVAPQRTLPGIHSQSLRTWLKKTFRPQAKSYRQKVYFFCDEFTNYNDTPIGQKAILLLDQLGYEVLLVDHPESGRAAISKGLLARAKGLAEANVHLFSDLINEDTPLLGLEPSAILSFRDEYPRLVGEPLRESAKSLAPHCLLIDEFLAKETRAGHITSEAFTREEKHVLLHGHCHQKSLSKVEDSVWLLSLPENYNVEVIPSGCCGMAGSFGYEAEHYEVSQQVGELVLFPAVRKAPTATIIAATGTSCRHQIADGTQRKAMHPVEVLYEALL
ncbi:MAG: FAD-binding and (Fe-S)-binding domain-containing protein [Lewinella sp.]|uniref:FAD-binding and (Fe-S)-binding domain-containing protein n=1 Tax=Lewinella sp. TaxID=2004506 RepID=UPI003D6A68B2